MGRTGLDGQDMGKRGGHGMADTTMKGERERKQKTEKDKRRKREGDMKASMR